MSHASSFKQFHKTLLALCFVSVPLAVILTFLSMPIAHANTLTVTNTNDSGAGSLRDAIANANPGDTIVFSLTLPATVTLSSELDITQTLTISGPGASLLTVSGNNATRVISVTSGTQLNLSGISISNGYVTESGGAGIYNSGILNISNAMLYLNNWWGPFGTCPVAGGGGGIYNSGTLNITNTVFSANTAGACNDSGGGIYSNSGIVSINNGTFSGNGAGWGGAINSDSGTLIIINSTFSGNNQSFTGGGIVSRGNTVITGTTFSSNGASRGGGIFNGGTLEITNSTFSGNSGNGFFGGGGIYNFGTMTVTNVTLSGNSANPSGGGILNSAGIVTLRNTIVTNSPTGDNCSGTITNGGNNIDDSASCGWGSNLGSMSNTNPLLGTLQNNGGPTQTMALLSGSPAIDSVIYNAPNGCPSTDQRGVHRPIGLRCDIGAYESPLFYFLPLIKKQ